MVLEGCSRVPRKQKRQRAHAIGFGRFGRQDGWPQVPRETQVLMYYSQKMCSGFVKLCCLVKAHVLCYMS